MVNDLTRGRPAKVLLSFSLPMLVGNVVQQFYNMVDLIIVGRFVGVDALAAVGATGSTMFLMFSLVAGLTSGASVVVSQYFGYGDLEKTRRTVAMSIGVLGIAALVLTAVGVPITRPVLQLLNTPPEIIDGAVEYLQIIFIGIVATVAYNSAASIIRAVGDSVTPLIFLVLAVVLNIGLDLLFVVVFHMGVGGAAWATVIAQTLSAVACIVYAAKRLPVLQVRKSDFKPDRVILRQTVHIGVPGGIQNSLVAAGSMVVQSVVNSFGPAIVAAFAAAVKLDQLAVQPMQTLGMASATFTAQNMGAGKIDRVKKGFWSAIGMSTIFCMCMTGVMFLFGRQLMMLFVSSDEALVLTAGVEYLRIVSGFYAVLGVILILEGMLRGAGDVLVPVFSCFMEIVVRIVAAYLLAGAFGYIGVWWTGPIAWTTGTLICGARYFSGKWQRKAVISAGEEWQADPAQNIE